MNGEFKTNTSNAWYQAACSVAIVSAVFTVFTIAAVSVSFYRLNVIGPALERQLEDMKSQLKDRPADTELTEQIRRLDLKVRRDTFVHRTILVRAGCVLIVFLSLLVIGLRSMAYFSKRPLSPPESADLRRQQVRNASHARIAVTFALVCIGSLAVFFALRIDYDFTAPATTAGGSDLPVSTEPPPQPQTIYASMEQIHSNWPGFRGPEGSGVCTFENIPRKWNASTGAGILWKSPIELPGNSSPVVWGQKVFVTGADETTRKIFCYDAGSGALLWSAPVDSGARHELELMEDTGLAASTPVTDGRRVCAIFANADIACFNNAGNKLWLKNLGAPDNKYGYASSLALYENLVFVQYDNGTGEEEKSKIFAFDIATGDLVWQKTRDVPNSWTSPIVAKVNDKYQLIISASPWTIAYDPATGEELWRASSAGGEVAPSPIYAAGKVFTIEPYKRLVAVNIESASGDITETNIAWQASGAIPDICSPLSDGRYVWQLTSEGTLTCCNITDGAEIFRHDLRIYIFASPSLVGDEIYLTDEDGVTIVIGVSSEFEELRRCTLGEKVMASLAFAPGRIYMRAAENLYCITGSE